jgi:hypothetical protein
MDGGADEDVVGGGDEAGDVVPSNNASASTFRQTSASVPLSKRRYKKLGVAKFVLDCLIRLQIV